MSNFTIPVGETKEFEYNGRKHKIKVVAQKKETCSGCFFDTICPTNVYASMACGCCCAPYRDDHTPVVFKEVKE